MKTVDMSTQPRCAQYEYFRTLANPYVSLTTNCDITLLRQTVLENGWPFFLTALYCAVNAANAVPELRRRIKGETVVEYETCISSHTVALPDSSYCYCELDCAKPFAEYLPYAQAEVEKAKVQRLFEDGEDPDRLFFVSSVPWVSFTALSLPAPNPADSNVRITFGKFFEQGGKTLLPINLTVNHALADGIHMAKFFEGFERRAANPQNYFIPLDSTLFGESV